MCGFEDDIFGLRTSTALDPLRTLLGFGICPDPHGSEAFYIFSTNAESFTAAQYQKLASILAAYRFYEHVLLEYGVFHRVDPTSYVPSLVLTPASGQRSPTLTVSISILVKLCHLFVLAVF